MKIGKGALLWLGVLALLAALMFLSFRSNLFGGFALGDPAPAAVLSDLDGNPVDLNSWRGKAVVLRFSSVDCASCADDFGLLNQWGEQFGEDTVVAAVQVGDAPESVRAALRGRSAGVPILLDPGGDVAKAFGVKIIPSFYFLTARGTLSSVVNDEIQNVDLVRHVRLAQSGGPGIEEAVKRVSQLIRCQECEGRSVWESDAPSSISQRERIRGMLLSGMREDEVVAEFEAQYGEWILMAPPVRGYASLAWLLPALALVLGVGLWARITRRSAAGDRPGGPRESGPGDGGTSRDADPESDKIARRIEEYM